MNQPSLEFETEYQPKYLAYCAANGNTPEQQLKADANAYPGGKMCGFILWVTRQSPISETETP